MCHSFEVTGNAEMSQVSRLQCDRCRFVRMLIRIAAVLVVFGHGTPSSAQTFETPGVGFPSDSVILAILKERVEEGRSAGMVVGLFETDGATRVLAYGSRSLR